MPEVRVLVVDDEPAPRELLVTILEDDGYHVATAADGPSALEAVGTFRPDLVLLDGGLPGMTGADVARRIRERGEVPIVFVTGADAAQDVRDGFRLGADDYIVKPFDAEELSWRVRAVLRRSGHKVTQVWEYGDLVVDERGRTVTRRGATVALTATEFQLLAVLIRNRSRVVSASQLLNQCWGYEGDRHVLEVHISSLRRKLEAHGPRIIQTVRAVGYVLRA